MSTYNEQFLLQLLQVCAKAEPDPLYPVRFAQEANVDRTALDRCLDELRRRGLIKLTEWVRGLGQGCALTDAGRQALTSGRLTTRPPPTPADANGESLSTYDRGEIVRDALMYPLTPYVGRILIGVNIAVFLLGALYAGLDDELVVGDFLAGRNRTTDIVLHKMGDLFAGAVQRHEFFPDVRPQFERIVLFSFLHIGLMHLGMNMYFLFSLGGIIESMWGRWRFLVIYLLAGIVSGCVVLLYDLAQQRNVATAGASGSMFGIFAALVVWLGLNHQHLPTQVIDAWRRNLGINLVLLVAINFVPGVSWQGHLGGAIGGMLVALLLHVQRFHPSAPVRWLALAAVPMVPIAFFVAVLWMAGWIGPFRA